MPTAARPAHRATGLECQRRDLNTTWSISLLSAHGRRELFIILILCHSVAAFGDSCNYQNS